MQYQIDCTYAPEDYCINFVVGIDLKLDTRQAVKIQSRFTFLMSQNDVIRWCEDVSANQITSYIYMFHSVTTAYI